MKDVLDDNLEFDENNKQEIGKIMLLTGAFLVFFMTVLYFLKFFLIEGILGALTLVFWILLSREMTHRINNIDSTVKESIVGAYAFIVFSVATFFHKRIILALIVEGVDFFYNLSFSIYNALGVGVFAFVIAYFVINKIRNKPLMFPIILILLYLLFFVVM